MTTPSSASGTAGQWQNPSYPVVNAQSLYTPNQEINPFASTSQPVTGLPTIPLGGSGPQAALEVVQVSAFAAYEVGINISPFAPIVAGQICGVDIYWWDNLGDITPIEHVKFEAAVGDLSSINTWGHGPMAGQWMAIVLTNQTATSEYTCFFSFTGTTRSWQNHDWRSDGGISSVTASGASAYTNELCIGNALALGASGGTAQRQIFLYSGQALLHVANLQGAGTIQASIQDSGGREIAQVHPAENGSIDELIELPRRLCQAVLSNSGAAATTANLAIIADRP
jgi:hypothetical protein